MFSKGAAESKGKQAICAFINEMCGVNVDDVSYDDDQCECIIGAITVCIVIVYILSYFSVFNCFRMEMTSQYVMTLC